MARSPKSAQPPKEKIVVGADHAGFHAKELIKDFLQKEGYIVEDVGANSEDSVDYPDFAREAAERVAAGHAPLGILVCGTGLGMAMTANKVPGVRAATAHNAYTARMAREHNDANVLTLGGRVVDDATALEIVRAFLDATFGGGRHQRRVDKINQLDVARASSAAATRSHT